MRLSVVTANLFLPFALDSPILRSLLASSRVRPMSFTEAEALTRIFPFLVRLELPRAVIDFERIVPSTDLILIAASNVVLVRKDIHPDPEYPVFESAIDFCKNGPSFLNRYLPFWMTNYARRTIALAAAVIAIILPLFSYAPKGYKWLVTERLNAMYRRLRRIEARLQNDVTAAEVSAFEADLDGVDRAIHSLAVPMRYSDVYFSVKSPSIWSARASDRAAPRWLRVNESDPGARTYGRGADVYRGFSKNLTF
jgi:hypothetical protein